MHLTPEELIDLAEGTRAETAAPHLQACEVCRHQVATLRATMSAAADVDVPEPSPLFWDHLSQRVREAVAVEEATGTVFPGSPGFAWRWALPGSWRAWAIAGVAAAVMISIYFTAPRTLAPVSGARDRIAVSSGPLEPFGAADDPSLILFADLTGQMDPGAITEAGWSSHTGAVDEVVASLSADERLELQRLLEEALAKS
jgi:hypothetical protein